MKEEHQELTELLDNHNVTEDSSYDPSHKESVYDVIGPLIAKSGGIGERRYYIAKDSGIKGSGVYADEFMPENTLIGVYTGVRVPVSQDTKYEWGYQSIPLYEGNPLPLGINRMYEGNMLRFLNDGKPENLNCRPVGVVWENRWYIVYMAKKDIYPGQELTVSYGSGYWEPENRGFTSY
jgi:SET domain-containing protein